MRKIVFLLFIIIVLLLISTKNSSLLIPNNAIRIRLIANSNDIKDQETKIKIKNDINNYLFTKLKNVDNYSDAKKIINNNIYNIKTIIEKYTSDYSINFGYNYFPEKEFKGTKYEAGNYESLVINLGAASGNNYWCVLFPPICLIDEQNLDNVTYELYIKKLLNKIK